MELTDRDRRIIVAVYRYRVLRRNQIQRLFFRGKSKAATNRVLRRLFHNGFLLRRFPLIRFGEGLSQALYLLDKKGADVVAEEEGVDRAEVNWKPHHNQVSSQFLNHYLCINDARIAVTVAAEESGYTLERWLDESTLKGDPDHVYIRTPGGKRKKMAVIPDSFFTLSLEELSTSFALEVDRGTITNRRWRERIRAYLAYVRSGKYRNRYRTKSLRVLTVTTTDKRLKNLKQETKKAVKETGLSGLARMFWFSRHSQVTQNPATFFSRPIWQVVDESDAHPLIPPAFKPKSADEKASSADYAGKWHLGKTPQL